MPALGHHLDEVTGAELERQVPPDTKDDDFLVEMSTPEKIIRRVRFRHPSRYRREPNLSSLHQNPHADRTIRSLLFAIRAQRGHLSGGRRYRFDGLSRQTIDQIDVDPRDVRVAQSGERCLYDGERLHPPDGDLNFGIEVLHAEAYAVDAESGQASRLLGRDATRVQLDGVLQIGLEGEMLG